MDRSDSRYVRIYPWFYGFSADLLFYIAIDTLFLTFVKGFSAAEIVSITSFSKLACLALQFPILFLIRRVGTTVSVRVGAFLLLLSSLLITFGDSYALVLVGRVCKEAGLAFDSASIVALEGSLVRLGRRDEFVAVRARAAMTYSVLTLAISVFAGYLFNVNRYLPMLGCILTCAIGFLLSFFLKDSEDGARRTAHSGERAHARVRSGHLVVLLVLVYSVFYLLVDNGQGEGKLFIQQQMLAMSDAEKTAVLISVMVFVSRLARVFSNAIVKRVYAKYREQLGVILACLMCLSISCMLFGSLIPIFALKISVMALGYVIILFSRDPFRLYIQDVVFSRTPREQHQSLLTVMNFGVKLACAGVGLVYSAILVASPMIVVISIMLAIAVIEIGLSLFLYRTVTAERDVEAR